MIVKISEVTKGGVGNVADNPQYNADEVNIVREQSGCISLTLLNVQHNVPGVGVRDMTGIIGVDAGGNMEDEVHWIALPCPPHCAA
ncbi:MAG: hypothetical protein KF852_15990 [Saprospiraceae bacterium]|nr:hypothetical protein [Saprospiraceae bacterium]